MTARIGSLFSGYGGLDMAVREVLGGQLAWVSDIEPGPSAILAHHHPGVPNLGDITAVDFRDVAPVDVLTGGFPCQDVSHAGRRAGLIRDGEGRTRSGLWGHMLRAIDSLRPSLVVAENVRGLLSARADSDVEPCPWCLGDAGDAEPAVRALGAVLADLADVGYDAAWCGLRAADVGVAHGRFRVFILAWPATADAEDLGHERSGIARRRWPGPADRRDDALALLPTPTATPYGNNQSPSAGAAVRPSLDSLAPLLPTTRAGDGDKGGPNQRGSSGDLMLPSAVQLLPTPVATDANGAGAPKEQDYRGVSLTDATERRAEAFGQYAPAITRWEQVTGREAPPPTEPTGRDGAERLSPRFVEWLMGLPAGRVTDVPGLTRNQQLRALGNGVVPQQAATALRWLLNTQEVAA